MTAQPAPANNGRVVAHRCDRFVGRTMNWLYDHLRVLPRYSPLIACDELQNRQEFPELTAWEVGRNSLARSVWRRVAGADVDPFVVWRLQRRKPRLLHSHFGYVAAGDYALQKALSVPWLIGFYGADVYALGRLQEWRAHYRRLFEACARALALGPVMAKHLAELGCPAEKIIVHPLGVDSADLPEISRPYVPGQPLRILFAGTYREKKGLKYSLEAIAAVRKAGIPVELELVGEGADKPGDRETEAAALDRIRGLGLEDIVRRHSFLAFRELLDLASRCHVFLGPSVTAADGDSEGTPFVLQQMMATAMPAVATVHSDIPYLFGNLAHLLVPERDSGAIAARLIEYASKPALLAEHGRLFRAQILGHFDVRQCAGRLAEIYDTLLD